MFTRKHFNAIADMIARNETREDITLALADIFESSNPLFDRERFFTACGFSEVWIRKPENLRAANLRTGADQWRPVSGE